MTRPRLLLIIAALLLILSGWLVRYCFFQPPAEQLARVQAQLIRAVEKRDWKTLESLLSPDFLDDYENDRASALESARQIFSGYFTLTIKTETTYNKGTNEVGMVFQKLKFEGTGTPVSQMVTTRVNQTTEPFVFHWHKKGRWPWNWKLNQVQNEYLNSPP
jgi:hypothetical protein